MPSDGEPMQLLPGWRNALAEIRRTDRNFGLPVFCKQTFNASATENH
jgi:hypothetical protein